MGIMTENLANDARPLYQTIADKLRNSIVRGEYTLGAMLPTE